MDASAGAYEVKDPYSKSSEAEVVTLQKSVPKVAVVVPFIGYAAIALQSKEGLIVIGLGIVLLIILFILSELWRKDDDDDDDDDDEEDNEEDDDDDEDDEEAVSYTHLYHIPDWGTGRFLSLSSQHERGAADSTNLQGRESSVFYPWKRK